jgi:hydroxyacylglutathione hydrolase
MGVWRHYTTRSKAIAETHDDFGSSMILVQAIPTYSNHYQWALWHHRNEQVVALVDPTDANAIIDWLDHGLLHDGQSPAAPRNIEAVLLTNRKNSDPSVVEQLQKRSAGLKVFDASCSDQSIEVLGFAVQAIPVRSDDSVAFWFKDETRLFAGTTLASIGCGSFTPEQAIGMWSALQSFRSLPDFTMLYSAQENTEVNCLFALQIDPDNRLLQQRFEEVKALRAASKPTLPTSIGLECLTNPFLRLEELSFSNEPAMQNASGVQLLAALDAKRKLFQ